MRKKIIILIAVLVFIVPLLSGCVDMVPVTARGGGWIPFYGMGYTPEDPIEGEGKTTFGFNVKCYNAVYDEAEEIWTYDVKGHFVYKDRIHDILVKGKITNATYWEGGVVFIGNYTVDGLTGEFMVGAFDDHVLLNEDIFSIQLTGEIYDGYINQGPISDGNITVISP